MLRISVRIWMDMKNKEEMKMAKNNLDVRGPIYIRQQKGHSVLLWLFLSVISAGLGLIVMLYFTISKNHFWHL